MDRCKSASLRGLRICYVLLGVCSTAATAFAQANPAGADRQFMPDPLAMPRQAPATGPNSQQPAQQLQTQVLYAGTSSREELESARNRLPWNQLSRSAQGRVSEVVGDVSLYRRLPTIRCEVDSRAYHYLSQHPDVAVSLWRAMGISEMRMWQTGPYRYECDLRDGTVGAIDVLYRDSGRQVVICEGQFQSPLLANPIGATGVMHLQTTIQHTDDGRTLVTHTADVFVKFASQTVEALAKVVSPMTFKMADQNFEEVTLFLRMMDQAMSRQPGWVEQMAGRMDGILPGRNAELLDVTAEVYVDAQRRRLESAGQSVSLDAMQPPVRPASAESPM